MLIIMNSYMEIVSKTTGKALFDKNLSRFPVNRPADDAGMVD
jgi:hypothetical protein